jgi:hypothetical protein
MSSVKKVAGDEELETRGSWKAETALRRLWESRKGSFGMSCTVDETPK